MPDVLNALVAFVAEHQRCGELECGREAGMSGSNARAVGSSRNRRGATELGCQVTVNEQGCHDAPSR